MSFLLVNVPGASSTLRSSDPVRTFGGTDGPTRATGTVLQLDPGQSHSWTTTWSMPHDTDLMVEPAGMVRGISWQFGSTAWDGTARRTIDLRNACPTPAAP